MAERREMRLAWKAVLGSNLSGEQFLNMKAFPSIRTKKLIVKREKEDRESLQRISIYDSLAGSEEEEEEDREGKKGGLLLNCALRGCALWRKRVQRGCGGFCALLVA